MLSYQHGYHTGNFADVVKHLTLTRILNYLMLKDKPLFYLETHSGRGIYDLKDGQATKTGEYLDGIAVLWDQRNKLDELFTPYLQQLKNLNTHETLRFYPGSPCIAATTLRQQDRLVCCELHPREFEYLEQMDKQGKKIFYDHTDGLHNLTALLPPPERRGLIFIDPSYEIKDEYKTVPQAIAQAYQRFETGVYCLWYPIIDKKMHEKLLRNLSAVKTTKTLRVEFTVNMGDKPGMQSCGLWIINPPYVLVEEMKAIMKQLVALYKPGQASYLIE
ncbi:23S rRNA (adenine(2030)-N(6))-methyltransferase RlmJ [Legionella dresdenensis]|uniref:Ribosomal RNA large subunit methyltransferase J n=1 Tax=Legionella dresdenensis TaxID=450200 RepID=A0ABV8CGX1_9GAMM